MASHQHKRPYAGSQPSITSYFSHQVSPTSTDPPTYSIVPSTEPSSLRSPPLPANVQSNLLSVGMRVRKSVPEGYKTGSYSAFTLFSDDTSPVPSQSKAQEQSQNGGSPIRNRPRARELTPFCGILKVGGMAQQHSTAQQQWGIYSPGLVPSSEAEEDDYVPVLSQGSTISNDSMPESDLVRGNHKRRGDFDDEEVEEQVEVVQGRVNILGLGAGGRLIAVPRRKKGVIKLDQVAVVGQENVEAEMDFGEADFLDYDALVGEDEDMDGV